MHSNKGGWSSFSLRDTFLKITCFFLYFLSHFLKFSLPVFYCLGLFLVVETRFLILNLLSTYFLILSLDKRIYQPSFVPLHSLATAHFPWPGYLLLASQTSKPSASVPCTFYSVLCPPLSQMLPLHLPVRITTGAQATTATAATAMTVPF